ncbi:class I SAM-dependent methyltransferase [Undibacterium sp. FT137W]|uniref:Class I SAM-dependent methyltransferase n=1 Tax=Undibacterium fentianense TaxID=2828728 RepID=A0A941IDQ3_9BURK|nr:class I SAM-dependent methyltransferase [Undibacterium fentianense]
MKYSIGVKSLFLQLGSLLFSLACFIVISKSLGLSFSGLTILLAHAGLAAFLALVFKFDWWWVPIQFGFPLLAYFCFFQDIPPSIYLAIASLLVAIFWSTFRTQVPYYPSKSSLILPLVRLIQSDKEIKVIDIGSGMGGLAISLARELPFATVVGIEIAPLPWLISRIHAIAARSRAKFILGNFYNVNFREFDVVFCYLSPAAMPAVWDRVKSEMRNGSLFLSFEFIVPDVQPDISICIDNSDKYLYGWHIY